MWKTLTLLPCLNTNEEDESKKEEKARVGQGRKGVRRGREKLIKVIWCIASVLKSVSFAPETANNYSLLVSI